MAEQPEVASDMEVEQSVVTRIESDIEQSVNLSAEQSTKHSTEPSFEPLVEVLSPASRNAAAELITEVAVREHGRSVNFTPVRERRPDRREGSQVPNHDDTIDRNRSGHRESQSSASTSASRGDRNSDRDRDRSHQRERNRSDRIKEDNRSKSSRE